VRKPASTLLKIAKLTEKMLKSDNRVLEKTKSFRARTLITEPTSTTEAPKKRVTIQIDVAKSTEAATAETTAEISREAVTMNYTLPPSESDEDTDNSRVEQQTLPLTTALTPKATTEGDDDETFESGMIIVGGEEFYDEPLNQNYSQAQAAQFGLPAGVVSNVPVGLILCLTSLSVSALLILFVYHCRLKYKWAAVDRPEDEPMDLRVLNSYRDGAQAADADGYRSEYGPLDVRY
jgi:hypothetical protein